jgi:hypothetical protein
MDKKTRKELWQQLSQPPPFGKERPPPIPVQWLVEHEACSLRSVRMDGGPLDPTHIEHQTCCRWLQGHLYWQRLPLSP